MKDLVEGRITFKDETLQKTFLDWIESEDYNEFLNTSTGERTYALSPKRGNVPYCAKKSKQRKALSDAIESKMFDWPAKGSRDRWTRIVFITLTYDHKLITRELSWASLRSSPIEGCDAPTGAINSFESNLSSIFGNLCKLVAKEGQSEGWAAPHLIVLLEKPVLVRRHVGKGGAVTWRLVDRRILRRLGKDSATRARYSSDHETAIANNPVWRYGFFDIQGVIKGNHVGRYKNEITYLFKYVTKCVTGETDELIDGIETISEAPDKLKTFLYTHLANKCFRTRDISFGKTFKERLGLVPEETETESVPAESPWKRIRTIPGFVHKDIIKHLERIRLKQFRELIHTTN